jgi:hypothetical protein
MSGAEVLDNESKIAYNTPVRGSALMLTKLFSYR